MKVQFTQRARRRVLLVSKWWKEHRPAAAALFDDELEQAVRALEAQPAIGLVYETIDGKSFRRILLRATAQHVYYELDAQKAVVVIHTVWGARRGAPPKLGE